MTAHYVEATDIVRRAEQGTLEPFLIYDSAGESYIVKGRRGAGGRALMAELICAELGKRLELPVPNYALMTFPPELLRFSAIERVGDLADGPAFASRRVPYSRELTFEQSGEVPVELQLRVLLFDIWINNQDRFLTEKGGNVNLLLDRNGDLVVIDHNLAFDDAPSNFANHVFSHQRDRLKDLEVQARYQALLETALEEWDSIIDLIPEEWRFVDPIEQTLPVHPDPDTLLCRLQRLHEASFWSAL